MAKKKKPNRDKYWVALQQPMRIAEAPVRWEDTRQVVAPVVVRESTAALFHRKTGEWLHWLTSRVPERIFTPELMNVGQRVRMYISRNRLT